MKFSVVIPAYNAEKFIDRSIKSVLRQTFSDFELIVVNDGSKDQTSQCAKAFNDERLIVIDKVNEGVSVARNTGIQKAKGKYICFLDADDEFMPEHLSVLSDAIENYPEKCFFATRFCMSMMDDNKTVVAPQVSGKTVYCDNVIEEIFRCSELIWTGCVCIRRDMFHRYGMFEPGVKHREDTDMWRRVYVHTGAVLIDAITVKRNRDGSELTKQYTRIFEVDPMNRMPMLLSDSTIADHVRESLKTEFELTKLQVARSYLISGDKKKARLQMQDIDKTRISQKRMLVTQLCFWVPSCVIRGIIRYKNRGLYE